MIYFKNILKANRHIHHHASSGFTFPLIIHFVWPCRLFTLSSLFPIVLFPPLPSMAATPSHLTSSLAQNYSFNPSRIPISHRYPLHRSNYRPAPALPIKYRLVSLWTPKPRPKISCEATEVSVSEQSPTAGGGGGNWIPVVPLAALPKGERRVIIQDGDTILLLWYKDEVFAIENRSPAEGAYSEGLINAKLTQV